VCNLLVNTKYDIITVGSAAVDVFIHTDPSQTEILNVHHHKDIAYPLGAKILINEMNFFVGGGGTNAAAAFSRLGLKTAFLGKIGKDDNGKTITDCLFKEKVDFIGSYGQVSGYSIILDSSADDRTIFAYKGCNNNLKVNDFRFENINSKWIYMSSMIKDSFNTQKIIVEYAKKNNIKIAYNPSLYLTRKGTRPLRSILKNTEILILNKEEAQALVKDPKDNVYNLLFEVSKLGPKLVIITDGSRGAHCYNVIEETVYSAKPRKVHIVETTGAGDAFASGFVAGVIMGKGINVSLKLGMLNAESVITHLGSKNILLDYTAFEMAERDNRTIFKKKL